MQNSGVDEKNPNDIKMTVPGADFDKTLDLLTTGFGFRIEMIFPADSPSTAVVSGHGTAIRLDAEEEPTKVETPSEWVIGRAGMQYRDLIPGRFGGRVIASHIRILDGGTVPDYVHFHKIDFQMIYCVRGRIRVVYEDQGGPFWLEPGDCVLQPPEIRHRVLEAEANSEVVEIGMPAAHETWADHDLKLPTEHIKSDKDFRGQRFVRHIAANAVWQRSGNADVLVRDTGISSATGGFANVCVLRTVAVTDLPANHANCREIIFYFVIKGSIQTALNGDFGRELTAGDSILVPRGHESGLKAAENSEILSVTV
ncbi:MAG: cupin domain-containing protein [Pyrinomonadaceae bacterium]